MAVTWKKLWLSYGLIFGSFALCFCTFGYYKIYTPYGTGDTIMQTWLAHKGPDYTHPHKKWIMECMDGEAVIGILDNGDDYTRLWYVWCKFMFPYKPPTQGIYPYFPSCHVRNFTTQYFCYHGREHRKTVNTFITGFYNHQWNWPYNRQGTDDLSPYKCCKTPNGYYIDYNACYYQPTHDGLWEYYDSPAYFTVYCATGYVMAGLARKQNPYTFPDYHIEWINCCRLGFGIPPLQRPPSNITYTVHNVTTYNYQRAMPNSGMQSRFATELEKDDTNWEKEPIDAVTTPSPVPDPWPTSGNSWPMSGINYESSAAQPSLISNSVDPTNSGLIQNPQLSEFFSKDGGSSTVGPVTVSV